MILQMCIVLWSRRGKNMMNLYICNHVISLPLCVSFIKNDLKVAPPFVHFQEFIMLGERALDLVREAKRSNEMLGPYNEDKVNNGSNIGVSEMQMNNVISTNSEAPEVRTPTYVHTDKELKKDYFAKG